MRPNEPSRPRPRAAADERPEGARVAPIGRDRSREGPFRAFRRPGIWTLAASIGLVVVTGVVTFRVMRSREARPAPDPAAFEALRAAPLDAAPPGAAGEAASPVAGVAPFPGRAGLDDRGRAALEIVEQAEQASASGALSVARRRFEPCPGEDVERVAWIDAASRVVKLSGTRADPQRVAIEQWFDREGRLRAVRATERGGAWSVRALLEPGGEVVGRAASGAAPELGELGIARRDPSAAFFATPRCDRDSVAR